MTYIGDIFSILGWIILGASVLIMGGIPALVGYVGATMLAVGIIVAVREVPR